VAERRVRGRGTEVGGPGAQTVTTALAIAATLVVVLIRMRARPDTNWPLFYYLLLIGYHASSPGRLNQYFVYLGAICTMLQRFEFMPPRLLKVLWGLEMIALAYVTFALTQLLITMI